MNPYYQIRSVLLSANSTAVTLEPITWYRESDTLMEADDEGNMIPSLVELANPGDDPAEGDEPMALGGPWTEFRFDFISDLQPGEYITIAFARTFT